MNIRWILSVTVYQVCIINTLNEINSVHCTNKLLSLTWRRYSQLNTCESCHLSAGFDDESPSAWPSASCALSLCRCLSSSGRRPRGRWPHPRGRSRRPHGGAGWRWLAQGRSTKPDSSFCTSTFFSRLSQNAQVAPPPLALSAHRHCPPAQYRHSCFFQNYSTSVASTGNAAWADYKALLFRQRYGVLLQTHSSIYIYIYYAKFKWVRI